MDTIILIVGKRLRARRTALGLSQEQLAELAGIHPTYVGQVERGEKNLTLLSLEKLCAALKISPARLFEGLPPEPESRGPALQCYDLINEADRRTQERILRILRELLELSRGN